MNPLVSAILTGHSGSVPEWVLSALCAAVDAHLFARTITRPVDLPAWLDQEG